MEEALKALKGVFAGHNKIGIAFSGGVDSTFLLRAAVEIMGLADVKAFTVKSPYIPEWEIKEARELCESLGVEHVVIELGIPEAVVHNPEDRCYLCKRIVFSEILKASQALGCTVLCDGTNFDDTKDYRPGLRALDELGVMSPLKLAELTKAQIRSYSKHFGLSTWDKPPYACLLTRIPYHVSVTGEMLSQIEAAEVFLMSKGLRGVRLRHHGDIARIEIAKEEMPKILDLSLMAEVEAHLRGLGFKFVTLDLGGYQTGCYNEGLKA